MRAVDLHQIVLREAYPAQYFECALEYEIHLVVDVFRERPSAVRPIWPER